MQNNRNKVKYLCDTAKESNAPFIVLTETHLKPEILSAEVRIEGYRPEDLKTCTGQTEDLARAMGASPSICATT